MPQTSVELALQRRPAATLAPTGVVWLVLYPSVYEPWRREVSELPWRPGLTPRDLLPDGWHPDLVAVARAGRRLATGGLDEPLPAGEVVQLLRLAGSGVFEPIVATVKAVQLAIDAIKIAFSWAQSLFLLDVTRSLLVPDFSLRIPNSNTSQVFGWSGIQTNFNPRGTPIGLQYGEHRIGGSVIAIYKRVQGGAEPQEILYMLLALQSGPVEAIGGITEDVDELTGSELPDGLLINGNDASAFADVTCYVRRGSLDQAPVPGFTIIPTTYGVALPIDQVTEASGDPAVTDFSMGAQWDMPLGQVGDRALITILFPGGLYRIDQDDGTFKKLSVEFEVRYQELNDAGVPIGNAVIPTGPGTFTVTQKITSPFTHQVEIPFFNPDTFVAPSAFDGALEMSSSSPKHYGVLDGDYFQAAYPQLAEGQRPDGFSFFHVLRIENVKDHSPVFAMAEWDQDVADPQVRGIMVDIRQVQGDEAELQIVIGESTSGPSAEFRAGEITEGEVFSLAVTYQRNALLGENRVRAYLNGVLVLDALTTVDLVCPAPTGGLVWNSLPGKLTAGSGLWHGATTRDEFRCWDRALSVEQVSQLHNAGFWNAGAGKAFDGHLFGAGFDNFSGVGFVVTPTDGFDDAGGGPASSIVLLPQGAATPTVQEGWVLDTAANTIKRARYRIEVQRLTPVKENNTRHDETDLESVVVIVDRTINYAKTALLGLRILANDQLNGSPPNVTVPVKGRRDIPIWDGIDPDNPGLTLAYSRNPAWCFVHLHLDEDDGAGRIYDAQRIDWPSIKEWADYCDVEVYDQKGKYGGAATPTKLVTLTYVASEPGFETPILKISYAKPIPPHFLVGGKIRLDEIDDGDYPAADFEILVVLGVDDDTFEIWVAWPDGESAPGSSPVEDPTALFYGIEPRFQVDLPFVDRGLPFLEARNLIAACGRAVPTPLGDKIGVSFEQVKNPVAVFNAANIVRGSLNVGASSRREQPNVLSGEFQSADLDFDREVVEVSAASVNDGTSEVPPRRALRDMRGRTRRSQVVRDLSYQVSVNELLHLTVEFEASLDGLFLARGDVFVLSHPMPMWDHAGRLAKTSEGSTSLHPDVAVILGSRNVLDRVGDLEHASWEKVAATGDAPEVTDTGLPGHTGDLVASEITFKGGSTNTRLRKRVPHRGTGARPTGILWARVASGSTTAVGLRLVTNSQVVHNEPLTITTEWQRFVSTGLSSTDDADLYYEIRSADPGVSDLVIEVEMQRLIYGDDDGFDAEGLEAPQVHRTHYAAISNPENDNEIVVAELQQQAGMYLPGERIKLADGEDFEFNPRRGWLWCIGPAEFASRLFEVTFAAKTMDHRVRIQALEYSKDVFPDENNLPALKPAPTAAELAEAALSDTLLPALPPHVKVLEKAARDPVTGALERGLDVSWSLESGTARLVDHVDVWLREVDGGSWERVGSSPPTRTRLEVDARGLEPGTVYEVAIQPRTRRGLATPLSHASRARVTYWGLFPSPPAPAGGRATLVGELATYEVDLPAAFQDAIVEVFRGGTFAGQAIGRIPLGGAHLGPTPDWCVLPESAAGHASPPLYFRLATAQGARGPYLRLDVELSPDAFPAALLEDSMEDGPWGTAGGGFSEAPVLTELETEASGFPGEPDRLHFADASSELEGTYESTIYDLGRPRHVHVSFGVEGAQVPPITAAEVRRGTDLYERSLSMEGYLDPNHPSYGAVGVHLEWATSASSGDPGSDYRPFRCGPAYVRSCRFRLRVTRPDATWDVWLARAAVAIRPMPRAEGGGFDAGEVTS